METNKRKNKPKGYWTRENCIKEAIKYDYKKEWEKGSKSSFTIAHKNNWIEECSKHMIKIGNSHHRAIYALEFQDNSVYIGLTHDIDERIAQHFRNIKSTVYKHIEITKTKPNIIKLTDYLYKDLAIKKEEEYLNYYKSLGWNILNISKTGSLGGGNLFWTKERCVDDALNYNSKKEWYENSNTAYKKSVKMKWLNDCSQHMHRPQSKKLKWTFEICREIAKEYKSKWEWIKNSKNSYTAAYQQKWFNECTKHMK